MVHGGATCAKLDLGEPTGEELAFSHGLVEGANKPVFFVDAELNE
jgi:hypothetical protein